MVEDFVGWCTTKMKEMVVNFRRAASRATASVSIDGVNVETVITYRYNTWACILAINWTGLLKPMHIQEGAGKPLLSEETEVI